MTKDTHFQKNNLINCGGKLVNLAETQVMGIINITPDSFYAGSRLHNSDEILVQVGDMIAQGASMIDIGAYSTRPGAHQVSVKEELARLIPAIELIRTHFPDTIISADTYRAEVAKNAVQAGANLINDIGGGTLDTAMFDTVADLQVPYILMHIKGTPETMQNHCEYDNMMKEIIEYFVANTHALKARGVHDVIIDPGFGFAKNQAQNLELLQKLDYFDILPNPLLVGISRKSMIYKTLGVTPDEALNGTTALHAIALQQQVGILRVHDVKAAVECIRLRNALQSAV